MAKLTARFVGLNRKSKQKPKEIDIAEISRRIKDYAAARGEFYSFTFSGSDDQEFVGPLVGKKTKGIWIKSIKAREKESKPDAKQSA